MDHDDMPDPDVDLPDLDLPDLPRLDEPDLGEPVDGPFPGGSPGWDLPTVPDLPDLDGPRVPVPHEPPPPPPKGSEPPVADGITLGLDDLDDLDDLDGVEVDASPSWPDDEIDLTLDDDLDVSGDEFDSPEVIELTNLDVDDGTIDAGDGSWLAEGLVVAGLGAIGVAVPVALVRRRVQPPDLAAHLDHLGIDARVEHFDLTDLEELMAAGGVVLVARDGSAGLDQDAVLQVHRIDRAAERVELVDAQGARRSIALARFESAWEDSAAQVVIAEGDRGRVALLPVVLDESALSRDR